MKKSAAICVICGVLIWLGCLVTFIECQQVAGLNIKPVPQQGQPPGMGPPPQQPPQDPCARIHEKLQRLTAEFQERGGQVDQSHRQQVGQLLKELQECVQRRR